MSKIQCQIFTRFLKRLFITVQQAGQVDYKSSNTRAGSPAGNLAKAGGPRMDKSSSHRRSDSRNEERFSPTKDMAGDDDSSSKGSKSSAMSALQNKLWPGKRN